MLLLNTRENGRKLTKFIFERKFIMKVKAKRIKTRILATIVVMAMAFSILAIVASAWNCCSFPIIAFGPWTFVSQQTNTHPFFLNGTYPTCIITTRNESRNTLCMNCGNASSQNRRIITHNNCGVPPQIIGP